MFSDRQLVAIAIIGFVLALCYFLGPGRYEYLNTNITREIAGFDPLTGLDMTMAVIRVDRLTGTVEVFDYRYNRWLTIPEARNK